MNSDWLAFDVGCLECGESSGIIGFYPTEEEAQAACDAAAERQRLDWHGSHDMDVFHIRTRSQYAGDDE